MITYELAKQLKDAGFLMSMPIEGERVREAFGEDGKVYLFPTLLELIEACRERFGYIRQYEIGKWIATDYYETEECHGLTPEEAVANLWLELNKHD